jgi:thiamine kinase-like enzyme
VVISPAPEIFDLSVDERLDMATSLADRGRRLEPLPGGLTNDNFKVTTSTGTFVARLARPSAGMLAIDRVAEHRNSLAAAAAGAAPEVVEFVPAAGLLVIAWLSGRSLTADDLRDDDTLVRVAAACRRLHAGPRFVSEFDMFDVARNYLRTIVEHGFRLPDRYLDFTARWEQVRTVLAMSSVPTRPCHNDLLAANIIEADGRIYLIDFEYSGNNDVCFELGNIWSESNLSTDQLELLVTSYFGEPQPGLTARARLQALVSQYGWTLWGVLQHAVSELDFDFWEWSMEKYDRAVATFDSPEFPRLLTAAAAVQGSTELHLDEGETL